MKEIVIPSIELYDEIKNEFVYTQERKLTIEHSLISLSKWESKWKKPFLDPSVKRTREESVDYVRCMTITQNVDPILYTYIPNSLMSQIDQYINDPMTATWFTSAENEKKKINREKVTSELIYYWMAHLQIPFECEKWHLNRLLTLIEIFNVKDAEPTKKDPKQAAMERAAMNAKRRAQLKTKG